VGTGVRKKLVGQSIVDRKKEKGKSNLGRKESAQLSRIYAWLYSAVEILDQGMVYRGGWFDYGH